MDAAALAHYLHCRIPLSSAMEVSVRSATRDSVTLAAPLDPNINDKRTAFGGSLATLGILAAWSLIRLRMLDEGLDGEIVIQSSEMAYLRPVTSAFMARSALITPTDWPRFAQTLTRRKRARIAVSADVIAEDAMAGRLTGAFVAFS